MKKVFHVIVLKDLNGMEVIVLFVLLEKLGIIYQKLAYVLLELNGITNFAQ